MSGDVAVWPSCALYSSNTAVSLMHVITEETVSHTIIDTQHSHSTAHSRAYYCCNTRDQTGTTTATGLTADSSTTPVPSGSDSRRSDNGVREINLSPGPNGTAVVSRVPSKASLLRSVGSGDHRADIAAGWKPVCGQTVVRRPPKSSHGSAPTTREPVGKPPQPTHSSLWTSFTGAARRYGTDGQPVPDREGCGNVEKDREPLFARTPSRCGSQSGVDGRPCEQLTKNPVDPASTNRTASLRSGLDAADVRDRTGTEPSKSLGRAAVTEDDETDLFFEQNGTDTNAGSCFRDGEVPSNLPPSRLRHECPRDKSSGQLTEDDKTDLFFEQIGTDTNAGNCFGDDEMPSNLTLSHLRHERPGDKSSGQGLLLDGTQGRDCVQRQTSPETGCREETSDHIHRPAESSPDRFDDGDLREKPLLNFCKDWTVESHDIPVPDKLWPDDDEPPTPKRSRMSSLSATEPSGSREAVVSGDVLTLYLEKRHS